MTLLDTGLQLVIRGTKDRVIRNTVGEKYNAKTISFAASIVNREPRRQEWEQMDQVEQHASHTPSNSSQGRQLPGQSEL